MISNETMAFVLRQMAVGETSQWVTFFTKKYGVLKVRVRGGRSPVKQALLQPFHLLWIGLNSQFKQVDGLELAAAPKIFNRSALACAFYFNELLSAVCQEQQAEQDLFDHYAMALDALVVWGQQQESMLVLEGILRRFERFILRTAGVEPSFFYEIGHLVPIDPAAFYIFLPGSGFKKNHQGFLGEHLLLIGDDHLVERAVLTTAQKIMKIAIERLTEGMTFYSRTLWSLT